VSADPSAGGAVLRRCVACSATEFAARYWGRAPLLSRRSDLPGGFDDLLDAHAVDELVSTRGLRTPFVRMAKDGTVLDRRKFTRSAGAGATIDDQVADDRVLAELAGGATLVLQALHRTWPPLVGFGTRLASELGHPVQINAYVTPPQNQGFAPHYDVHDVFVLQVAGRKRWTIHAPVVTDPLDNQPWEQHRDAVARRAGEAPLIDTELEPGDALYLPRGTIHSAKALGETSIHLTVGIHPLTRYHLVRHLLERAQQEPQLRTSLPVGVDLSDPAVLAPHLGETLAALTAHLADADAPSAAQALGVTLQRQTRPAPIGPLSQLDAALDVVPDSPLRLREGLRATVQGEAIRLVDRTISVPAAALDAVKLIVSGVSVTPAQLPGLDGDEQLVLARRLLREGVVVPVEQAR
jgi:hypothetical protein